MRGVYKWAASWSRGPTKNPEIGKKIYLNFDSKFGFKNIILVQ
jgi:hypothetical protein